MKLFPSKARADAEAARASEVAAAPAAAAVDVDPGEPAEQEVERRPTKLVRMSAFDNQSGGASSRSSVASRLRESWQRSKR